MSKFNKILQWTEPSKIPVENWKMFIKNGIYNKKGVYIWLIRVQDSYFVHYIGKSIRSFQQRHLEHLRPIFNGKAYIYDMESNNATQEITRIACEGNF